MNSKRRTVVMVMISAEATLDKVKQAVQKGAAGFIVTVQLRHGAGRAAGGLQKGQ